jgi:hypothetical protein
MEVSGQLHAPHASPSGNYCYSYYHCPCSYLIFLIFNNPIVTYYFSYSNSLQNNQNSPLMLVDEELKLTGS